MSNNSKKLLTEADVTFERETDPLDILENQVQFLDIPGYAKIQVIDLIMALREDESVEAGGPSIEEQYETIEQDVFLKWDDLEEKKAELREILNTVEEYPIIETFFPKLILEDCKDRLDAYEEYQEELETTQKVLEFEKSQHEDGKR